MHINTLHMFEINILNEADLLTVYKFYMRYIHIMFTLNSQKNECKNYQNYTQCKNNICANINTPTLHTSEINVLNEADL